jgi:UbiD family decarboxylase
MTGAAIWDHLEQSGITDVVGVWGHCRGLMMVIALKQRYAGHAKQALLAASGLRRSASMSSYFVAVDEDIDPSNIRDVLWAMCTRGDPTVSVETVRSWTSDLDSRLTPEQKKSRDYTMGRVLVDACKPFHWQDLFPKTNIFPVEEKLKIKKKWAVLLENWIRLGGAT